MNRFLLFLEKYLAAAYVLLIGLTIKFNIRTPVPSGNVIFTFWHRNMVPLMLKHKFSGIAILVSASRDGELIAGPASVLGYKTARGSSGRKGMAALKKMVTFAKENSLGVTPDGPKGPPQIAKDGVAYLSYLAKIPMVPVAVDIKPEKVFKTWDKFRMPHFFCKISISYGEPIFVKTKEEIQTKLAEFQEALEKLEEENKI
ncbi:MAG: lysophospholipid acyltransferase family protein [Candidatus Cloacimonadales bacterium]|nr:lysophospholipid acyltransferase family protein [Candidatus Cloacimonadales bacterium]